MTTSPNAAVTDRAATQVIEDFKSPSVAVNPRDPSDVVIASRFDSPDFMCQIHHSLDGGRTWQRSAYPAPPRGTCWAPQVAFDDADGVYVAAQHRPVNGGAPQDIIVWRSRDGGRSFTAPVTVPGSNVGAFSFSVQAGITVDTTRTKHPNGPAIYVTWYNFPNFPSSIETFVSVSEDGGATWSPAAGHEVAGEYQQFGSPAVGPEGNLYVAYKDPNNFGPTAAGAAQANCPVNTPAISRTGTCPIRVLRSTDGGRSFDSAGPNGAAGFPVAVAAFDDLTLAEGPGIVTTPGGEVLVTYASLSDATPRPGCQRDLDVFVARSTDKAVTWGAPVRINDDACDSGARQRDPWISVAPNGRVDAVFYDDRNDVDHALGDAYYTSSSDGGRSFGPNRRVSDRSFDARVMFTPRASGFQSKEFDTVNGIASAPNAAVVSWGDSRGTFANTQQGDPASAASDVVAARVDLANEATRPVRRITGADPAAAAVALSSQTYN
ncbi:MAG: hypothetical protein ACRDZW_08920, partial [Acidimicrobiales bacterium]